MPDSDDDSDDGFYLTSSSKTADRISSSPTVDDESDDDDDDDDYNWEKKCEAVSSAAGCYDSQGDRVCSDSLPSQAIKEARQECVEQAADLEFAMSSSDDEELAGFAASFDDIQPAASASEQSGDGNAVKNVQLDLHGVAGTSSAECLADSDNELTAVAWQRLHGSSRGTCALKVEGIDDVTDFISEFVHQSAAPSAETTGNLIISINDSS